ncbi:MAG: hypothetical protein M1831_005464 [Alyxoria varia]|nr:MAG: hypothetical protein M1831_005464 [Alyxoria varia]
MPIYTKDPKQRNILGFFGQNGQPKQSHATSKDRAAPASLTNGASRGTPSSQTRTKTNNSSRSPSSPLSALPSKSPETPLSLSKHPGSHAPSSQSSVSPQKLPLRHGTRARKPQLGRFPDGQRNDTDQNTHGLDGQSNDDVIVLQPKSRISDDSPYRPAHHPTEEAKSGPKPPVGSTSLKRKRIESVSNQDTHPSATFITISSGTSSPSGSSSASPSSRSKVPLQKYPWPQRQHETTIVDSESSAEELYPAQEPAQTPTVQDRITDSSDSESESDSSYLGDPGIAELVTGKFRRIHSKPCENTKRIRTDGKFSLANMVKQEKNKKDAQDRVLQYQKKMESMDQAESSLTHEQGEQYLRSGKLDKSLLASMVNGKEDEGNVDKVAQALDRAEVLRMEVFWSFFETQKPACAPLPFPFTFTGSQGSRFESLKDAKMCAIHGLVRLALDCGVARDQDLVLQIDKAMIELVASLPNSEADERLSELAFALAKAIEDPILAHRVVSRIPDTSPRLHLLRRRLALYYFCRDECMLTEPLDRMNQDSKAPRTDKIHRIVQELERSPNFDVFDQDLDYRHVSARLSLLDIGVAGGFSRPSLTSQTSSPLAATPALTTKPTKANPYKETSAPLSAQSRRHESEMADFNSRIDRLIKSLRSLGARIVDPGAAHLTRTEAKGVLERMLRRLNYGVRINPPKHQSKQSYLISDFGVKKGSPKDEGSLEEDDDDEDDEDMTEADAESEAADSTGSNEPRAREESGVSGDDVSRRDSSSLSKGKQVRFASPEKPGEGLTTGSSPPDGDGTADTHQPSSASPSLPQNVHATDGGQRDPSSSLSDPPSSMFNSGSDNASAAGVAGEG